MKWKCDHGSCNRNLSNCKSTSFYILSLSKWGPPKRDFQHSKAKSACYNVVVDLEEGPGGPFILDEKKKNCRRKKKPEGKQPPLSPISRSRFATAMSHFFWNSWSSPYDPLDLPQGGKFLRFCFLLIVSILLIVNWRGGGGWGGKESPPFGHVSMYGLLTKCEVKMAGYWPSSFFACLWTETNINSQKKNEVNIQPSWPNKLGQ